MRKECDADADPDYRNDDLGKAFFDVNIPSKHFRIPIGLIYHGEFATFRPSWLSDITPFHFPEDRHIRQHLEDVFSSNEQANSLSNKI